MLRIRHVLAKGFTLVEIAIVIVIIGLLISGGLIAVGPVILSAQISETESKMDIIEDALILHAIRYNCLPCPADAADLAGADAGQASDDTPDVYGAGNCAPNGQVCDVLDSNAIVPWVNLGLSEGDVIDGFGNYFGYFLDPGDLTIFQDDGGGAGQFFRAADGTYTNTLGTISVNDAGAVAVTTEAAYILMSYGVDGDEAIKANGAERLDTGSTDPDQNENTNGDQLFVQDLETSVNDADYFDDIVRFKSGPLVIQQCGSGSCGNP